jgi:hypothetical protein
MEDDTSYKFLRYMDLAMDPVPAEEFAVDDFAVRLLTMLGTCLGPGWRAREWTSHLLSTENNARRGLRLYCG